MEALEWSVTQSPKPSGVGSVVSDPVGTHLHLRSGASVGTMCVTSRFTYSFLPAELQFVNFAVEAVLGQQFVVGAAFEYAAAIQH